MKIKKLNGSNKGIQDEIRQNFKVLKSLMLTFSTNFPIAAKLYYLRLKRIDNNHLLIRICEKPQ